MREEKERDGTRRESRRRTAGSLAVAARAAAPAPEDAGPAAVAARSCPCTGGATRVTCDDGGSNEAERQPAVRPATATASNGAARRRTADGDQLADGGGPAAGKRRGRERAGAARGR
ncbi:hypothetical protein Syun_018641 [Stephania yunnanensis]|uniref:Uncharacterized protein n=1 Tax=Stephania yunnanensis TaxID=152371 RepID=A0AAP0ISS0_9MAGN